MQDRALALEAIHLSLPSPYGFVFLLEFTNPYDMALKLPSLGLCEA